MRSADRIVAVEHHTAHTTYPHTVGRNARLGSHGTGPRADILLLRTETGVTGWGARSAGDLDDDAVLGRRLDEVFDPAVGVVDAAAAPFDLALHDLAGQLANVPVYRLLGAAGDPRPVCYDGAIYFDDLDPEDDPVGIAGPLGNCAADHELGYRAFKLKIGRGNRWMSRAAGDARDIEITRAVRTAYPNARILVDANDGYDCAGVIEYLRAVDDCDLFWLEEPFPDDESDLRRLRDYLGAAGSSTLVADGETDPDVPSLLETASAGLIDVLLMDVCTFGFTPWRRLMPELVRRGVAGSPHAWGVPLKTFYAAQLAAGLGNVPAVEGVPGTIAEVDSSGYQLTSGRLQLPTAPGFGLPWLG